MPRNMVSKSVPSRWVAEGDENAVREDAEGHVIGEVWQGSDDLWSASSTWVNGESSHPGFATQQEACDHEDAFLALQLKRWQ